MAQRLMLQLLALAALVACASASSALLGNPTTGTPDGHPAFVHPKTLGWSAEALNFAIDPAVVISVSSYELRTSPATFTVSWRGVSRPGATDVIGLWSPGELNASAAAPVMWQSANVSGYLATGSGSANFTTYNLRNNMIFRLVSGDTVFPNPSVIAESPLIMNRISNMPQQVHLSLHSDGRSVVVQFVSNTSDPIPVSYGNYPGIYRHTAYSTAVTYTKDQMCGGPAKSTAFTHPGWTHTAKMRFEHLSNNRRIYYQVGNDTVGRTREFSFLSPPKAGSSDPVKFVVFNDVGSTAETLFNDTCVCTTYPAGPLPPASGYRTCTTNANGTQTCCVGYCPIPPGTPDGQDWYLTFSNYTYNSIKLAPVLAREEADAHMAILNGDLSYAQGYTDSWDIFGHQMEPAFSMWPLMTGTGNHERDWPGTGDAYEAVPGGVRDSGGECNVPYTYRYYNPGPGDLLDPRSSYYSFTMGPVFFLILDSESETHATSPQGMWIAQTLDKVNRHRTPWVVVSFHRMMNWMSTDTRPIQGDLDTSARLLMDLEDVFKGRVHIVTAGHQHAYGRTCTVYKGNCTQPRDKTFIRRPDAPIYVLTGNAGAGFTHSFPTPANVPSWVAAGWQDINGYVRFEADKDTLTMQAIATDPLNWNQGTRTYSFGTGAVFDSVTLSLN